MIQPRNGYNQYYFSLDSTVLEAKLARPRSGRGRGQNFGLEALTPLQCILFNSRLPDVVNVRVQFETRQLNDARLSSLHCRAYITKYFIKKGSKVYCTFVDASKAFDKVLHNGLFVKPLKRNVSVRFVYVLRNWYSKLCASVIWNGVIGPVFPIHCGVRTSRWYFITVAVFSLY